jgi:hypothetical protein
MKYGFLRTLAALLGAALLTGCVTHIPFDDQLPKPQYAKSGTVLISVVDNRDRVKAGKPRNFIGVAHGSFGIPFDWSVPQVLDVEDGDKNRDLSAFLQHRLTNGLQKQGWTAQPLNLTSVPSEEEAKALLLQNKADSLIVLDLKEWYFSINLNWVSDFNFDTDTDVSVFRSDRGRVVEHQVKERDVITVTSSSSPQNNILGAYREQLKQLIEDQAVQTALKD